MFLVFQKCLEGVPGLCVGMGVSDLGDRFLRRDVKPYRYSIASGG